MEAAYLLGFFVGYRMLYFWWRPRGCMRLHKDLVARLLSVDLQFL